MNNQLNQMIARVISRSLIARQHYEAIRMESPE